MGNFCVKCGRPLTEGQPCECERESMQEENVVQEVRITTSSCS